MAAGRTRSTPGYASLVRLRRCARTLGPMLRRLDLRAAPLPRTADLRGLLPRAEVDVDAVLQRSARSSRPCASAGPRPLLEFAERFDRVRPARSACRAQTLEGALAALDPSVRTALETSIERARAVHADQRRTDIVTQVVPGGTVTERFVPVRRVGSLRARRARGLPVQRGHERGAGAGGRGRVAGGGLAAAGRARRPAAPHHPRRGRAARRRRGVGGRRGAGRRAAGATAAPTPTAASSSPSTWSPGRATSTSPRPSGCCAG